MRISAVAALSVSAALLAAPALAQAPQKVSLDKSQIRFGFKQIDFEAPSQTQTMQL